MFAVYKPGQAKPSRTSTFLIGLFLILWGCVAIMLHLPRLWAQLGDPFNVLFMEALPENGWTVDLVFMVATVGPALAIAALIAIVGSLWWWKFLNTPKWADLLIEMETELKKVSWPTASDAWQSTLVVTGFTIALVVAMFVYDVVIKGFMELVAG